MNDRGIFRTLSALDCSRSQHFNLRTKEVYHKTLQRRQTTIMSTAYVMERSYGRALSYGKIENDEKLGRSDERMTRFEGSEP